MKSKSCRSGWLPYSSLTWAKTSSKLWHLVFLWWRKNRFSEFSSNALTGMTREAKQHIPGHRGRRYTRYLDMTREQWEYNSRLYLLCNVVVTVSSNVACCCCCWRGLYRFRDIIHSLWFLLYINRWGSPPAAWWFTRIWPMRVINDVVVD